MNNSKLLNKLVNQEICRQNNSLELIASENYPSMKVRELQSSILTCKYAEGYPRKRYYGGCEYVDMIENLAISEACNLFDCNFANVQPHSGSQANAAAYRAMNKILIEEGKIGPNDKMKILSMKLSDGGHLTHGSPVSFSSNTYKFSFFDLRDGYIDIHEIEKAIIKNKPHVLLIGCSAYPYEISFSEIKELVVKYNLKLIVDMAHIAGLVAADYHISPIPYADIVTSTTHKTLRGPRGGLILWNNSSYSKHINSAVFPYYQGGPLEHIIAAKAQCFIEANTKSFKTYIKNVLKNTKAFSEQMNKLGAFCSNTDNHLVLLNTKKTYNLTGLAAQQLLEQNNITTNKNMLPGDTLSPKETSGLRIGFAALTTRGCTVKIARKIAYVIHKIFTDVTYDAVMDVLEIINNLKYTEVL